MPRRRKVVYPPPKTASSGASAAAAAAAAGRAQAAADRTTTINLQAITGRAVSAGARVRIASGLYAGEVATVESVVGGVIPAAIVRTEAGRTRRARTVDLIPEPDATPDAG